MYQKTLDEINRKRPHILSHREEALLAEASDPLRGAAQTFGVLNNADLVFPTIKNEKGDEGDLTHGRFMGLLESSDRRVRKDAFKAMYVTYGTFKNTFASTPRRNVNTENLYADIKQ